MYIKKIKIENFRSIDQVVLELNNINIFFGLNDAGKSNVLKALNLFFNGFTDNGKSYDFERDFCQYTLKSIKSRKKAPEIKIELTLAYYTDGSEFTWEKAWRNYGLVKDDVSPIYDKDQNGKLEARKRSKHEAWARGLIYRYVPAMKDEIYFSTLLTEFYNVFSVSIGNEIKKASQSFVQIIDKNTKSLSGNLNAALKMNTRISLPSDLSNLFSTLDFKTENRNKQDISLNNRGDGIKIRHIPIILGFFASEQRDIKVNGKPRIDTIWGYEEPENNLELQSAFEKAKEFKAFSNTIQILLTTHSPAFYSLKTKDDDSVNLYNAFGENKGTKYKVTQPEHAYKTDQGFLTLISPMVEEKIKEIDEIKENLEEMKEKNLFDKNVIFVEGKIDKIILEHFIKIKYSALNITVVDSGGCTQTKKNMISWLYNPIIENPDHTYKAFALFDCDDVGNKSKKELEEYIQKVFKLDNNRRSKSSTNILKIPQHLVSVKSVLKENYHIEIEELFPKSIWEYAKNQDWLEEQNLCQLSSGLITDPEKSAKTFIEEQFSDDEKLYVLHKVKDSCKERFAKYVIKQDISIFAELENSLKSFLDKVNL